MKKILIATTNPGKKKEILEALKAVKNDFEFLSLADFPALDTEPDENAATFEENALIKARFYGDKFQITTLAEDSGLILSAFPDKFGVRTRREIQADNDMEWLRQFLDLLDGVADRACTFYSAFGWYDPVTKEEQSFLGITKGTIVDFPAAPLEKGVPVSAVFCPDGEIDVYSAMSKEHKNEVSHRGKAAELVEGFLGTLKN